MKENSSRRKKERKNSSLTHGSISQAYQAAISHVWWRAIWKDPPSDRNPYQIGVKSPKIFEYIAGQLESLSNQVRYHFICKTFLPIQTKELKKIERRITWLPLTRSSDVDRWCKNIYNSSRMIEKFPRYGKIRTEHARTIQKEKNKKKEGKKVTFQEEVVILTDKKGHGSWGSDMNITKIKPSEGDSSPDESASLEINLAIEENKESSVANDDAYIRNACQETLRTKHANNKTDIFTHDRNVEQLKIKHLSSVEDEMRVMDQEVKGIEESAIQLEQSLSEPPQKMISEEEEELAQRTKFWSLTSEPPLPRKIVKIFHNQPDLYPASEPYLHFFISNPQTIEANDDGSGELVSSSPENQTSCTHTFHCNSHTKALESFTTHTNEPPPASLSSLVEFRMISRSIRHDLEKFQQQFPVFRQIEQNLHQLTRKYMNSSMLSHAENPLISPLQQQQQDSWNDERRELLKYVDSETNRLNEEIMLLRTQREAAELLVTATKATSSNNITRLEQDLQKMQTRLCEAHREIDFLDRKVNEQKDTITGYMQRLTQSEEELGRLKDQKKTLSLGANAFLETLKTLQASGLVHLDSQTNFDHSLNSESIQDSSIQDHQMCSLIVPNPKILPVSSDRLDESPHQSHEQQVMMLAQHILSTATKVESLGGGGSQNPNIKHEEL